MSRGKNAARWGVLLIFLAACLYIAWKVPYTHDDWDWGLPVGVERLGTAGMRKKDTPVPKSSPAAMPAPPWCWP